eukprot:scaffold86562_cov69-Phaeocystis_antarctica.AAC.3
MSQREQWLSTWLPKRPAARPQSVPELPSPQVALYGSLNKSAPTTFGDEQYRAARTSQASLIGASSLAVHSPRLFA